MKDDLGHLVFRPHAIKRMFERRIGRDEVRNVLDQGEVIEAYPEDRPFPSQLVLGWDGMGCGRFMWSPLAMRRKMRPS